MALKNLTIDGFGQLELNNCAFRRDGRIEAQCKLSEDFSKEMPAENGMILAVDNMTRTIKLPAGDIYPVALVYSAEHLYDERAMGLKNFANTIDGFFPRLGYLAIGDKFTTNTVCYDDAEFADDEALKDALKKDAIIAAPVYGGVCENGRIKLSATEPTEGPVLVVINGCGAGSMPDGQYGVQLQVVKA